MILLRKLPQLLHACRIFYMDRRISGTDIFRRIFPASLKRSEKDMYRSAFCHQFAAQRQIHGTVCHPEPQLYAGGKTIILHTVTDPVPDFLTDSSQQIPFFRLFQFFYIME